MSGLPADIKQAASDPPRFYPGDRVRMQGNIEGQNHATVIKGPSMINTLVGPAEEGYLVEFDHRAGYPCWKPTKYLTRLDVCTQGCEAKEGELHGG